MNKLDKLHRFLSYLHQGHLLKVEGRTYGMTEDYQLYCLPYVMNGSEITDEVDRNHPLGMYHLPLTHWIEVADKLTENELFIMSANEVLNDLQRKVR